MDTDCCIICRSNKNDGIIIYGKKICRSCEKKISEVDMDSKLYEYYKLLIREKLVKPTIKGECGIWKNYH